MSSIQISKGVEHSIKFKESMLYSDFFKELQVIKIKRKRKKSSIELIKKKYNNEKIKNPFKFQKRKVMKIPI